MSGKQGESMEFPEISPSTKHLYRFSFIYTSDKEWRPEAKYV